MGVDGHFMNLCEYQSKELFAHYAIPIPKGPGSRLAGAVAGFSLSRRGCNIGCPLGPMDNS
jgi:hypothetical protein